jgi:acyl carrier protein phosphodiesterase
VLTAIDLRLSRPGLLLECLSDLQRLYTPLFEDFQQFYPQLQAFAASERERLD